jgi:hypothetical protein
MTARNKQTLLWTSDDIQAVRTMAVDGFTAAQIGQKVQRTVSPSIPGSKSKAWRSSAIKPRQGTPSGPQIGSR